MKTPASPQPHSLRLLGSLLALLLASANAPAADAPQTVLTDPYVTAIDGFELYGNGLYWWREGTTGIGGSPGVVAYNAFTGAARTGVTPSSLGRLTGGFRHGGSVLSSIILDGPPGAGKYLVRNDTDCGREAVRDEAFAYYVRGGTLRRKGLHRSHTDSDEEILRHNPSGPPFAVPIVADGASFLDDGWLYYWDSDGVNTALSRVRLDSVQPRENIATFPGLGLRKALVTAVLAPDGTVAGRYVFALTTNRNLYRIPFQTSATPFIVASNISDFTARDEQAAPTSPFRQHDDVTRIYASTYSLNSGINGLVWAINGLSLDQSVEYDSGSTLTQVRSVTCDRERLFIATALLTTGGTGNVDTGSGNLVRRVKGATLSGGIGPWQTISVETGGNLRSTGAWVYFRNANSIKKIRTDAPALQLALTAMGLEVVQVIQDMNNTVPLIGGKSTIVRGYARVSANTTGFLGPYFYPTAQVVVRRGLVQLGTVRAFNRPQVGPENHLGNLRANSAWSFLFDIPTDWVRAGNISVFFTVNPDHAVMETDANWDEDNTVSATLTCLDKQRPGLVFVPMASQIGAYQPGGPGFWDIVNQGESLLPVNGFEIWFRGAEVTKPVLRARIGIPPWEIVGRHFQMPEEQKAALLWLAVARVMDKRPPGAPPDLHWVGMFPRGIPSFNGLGGAANRTVRDMLPDLPGILEPIVGDFTVPPNALSSSLIMRMEERKDSLAPTWLPSRGGNTLAHELAHNYGRFHIPYGPLQFPEGPYDSLPFPLHQFGPADHNNPANIVGYSWFRNVAVLPGLAGDLMSYAEHRWPSRETYMAIMNVIPDVVPPAPAPMPEPPQPDGGGAARVMIVQGNADDGFRTGALGPIYRLDEGDADPGTLAAYDQIATELDGVFPLRLRALDANGALLDEFPMIPSDGHADGGAGGDRQFLAMFDEPAGTAKLEMVRMAGNTLIASLTRSFTTPTVQVGAVTLDDDVVEVEWIAEDADGDPLLSVLQFTPDDGASWQTLTANAAGQSAVVPFSRLPGGASPRFRVIVSDGFRSAQAESPPMAAIPNRTPQVTIVGLNESDRMAPGQTRALTGAAWDVEDGRIEDLTWVLNGASRVFEQSWTGPALMLEGLAPGVYALSLYATDSKSVTGVAAVTFEVLPIGLPESATAPEIDGLCGDPAYATATVAPLPNDDGTTAEVRLLRYGGAFYACFTGLRYGTGGSPGATAGIQFDTDAGGGTTAQLGDVGFFVDENGVPWQSEGDGASMAVRAVPAGGVELAIVRNAESWSAEFCIPNGLIGGAAGAANFFVSHDNVEGAGAYRSWPPGATPDAPGTWAGGAFGTPDPPVNGAPVANAGFSRVLVVSAGDVIEVDGLASHDPDGDALTFSWTQVAGPSVTLDDASSATPRFIAPAPSAELRFSLTVNDGTDDSLAASEVTVSLLAPTPLPLNLPPAVTKSPDGFLITLLQGGVPGACYDIEVSETLTGWRDGGTATVDLFGLLRHLDTEGVPPEGRRFYRAKPCGAPPATRSLSPVTPRSRPSLTMPRSTAAR